jgi:hypothetical protein
MRKGTKHSEETKRKMSLKSKGKNHSMWGKKHTEETKRKMRLKKKGKNNPLWGKRGEDSPNWGRKHSEETKRKVARAGEKNNHWRGGIRKCTNGYVYAYSPNHPYAHKNYVFEHRLVMEKKIGRYLKPKEVVHHINGDVKDNRIENLQLFENNAKHMKHHTELRANAISKEFTRGLE